MMNGEPDYACDLVNICMEENINQMEENINQITCALYKEDDGRWESALIYICTYRKTKQSIHLYTELHHTNARAGTHEL